MVRATAAGTVNFRLQAFTKCLTLSDAMEVSDLANCVECGAKLGFINRSEKAGLCVDCFRKEYAARKEERIRREKAEKQALEDRIDNDINSVLLTTETVSSLNIVERIEIVTAEVAFGQNIFKDLFAGVRDIVGGRSEAVQKTMRDARREHYMS